MTIFFANFFPKRLFSLFWNLQDLLQSVFHKINDNFIKALSLFNKYQAMNPLVVYNLFCKKNYFDDEIKSNNRFGDFNQCNQ